MQEVPLWEIVRTAHVVARGFHRVFAEAGLTATQFGVLAELADRARHEKPSPSQAELARIVLLRPQSVGELVADLVERGLVRRDGPGGRGRRAGLELTDDGHAALDRAWPLVQAFNAAGSTGLADDRAAELVAMLRTVRESLSAGGSLSTREPTREPAREPQPAREA
ncbi:MarR family winged helix-turn-helix transcriptional regulator [Pseudonocardia parietis]|uniref:DNA-binding MarR family transcriptional regulator n=1 Tax=Pseudonocardia parietis TaxID=570936 RepID=A0ABS4W1J7_9PSEU|nr:MarR family winged helix-turn-helix transcriptional regulator [Pseudonocardia parietis]MBP2370067.1 DNA-binding MarR family transcriptional regulator [Pseudonocardia parietis]